MPEIFKSCYGSDLCRRMGIAMIDLIEIFKKECDKKEEGNFNSYLVYVLAYLIDGFGSHAFDNLEHIKNLIIERRTKGETNA